MGATNFCTVAKGKTAQEAFDSATTSARYEEGCGGYTGTIAEKHEFRIETPPDGVTPLEYIRQCMTWDEDRPYHWAMEDKWGPACAVLIEENKWAFFGTASS